MHDGSHGTIGPSVKEHIDFFVASSLRYRECRYKFVCAITSHGAVNSIVWSLPTLYCDQHHFLIGVARPSNQQGLANPVTLIMLHGFWLTWDLQVL